MLTIYIPEGAGSGGGFRIAGIGTMELVIHGEFHVQLDFSVDPAFHDTENTNAYASLRLYDENDYNVSMTIRTGRYTSGQEGSDGVDPAMRSSA
ncbi:MAG: hypothetical protein PVG79_04100 [Gemmatimonadales bacterium]